MELSMEPTSTLDTQYESAKVFVVIGAGGTGSYLIPNLARQIAITNRIRNMEDLPPHKLLIIDADTVGLSNLNRQNFIEKDLDLNKAEVLAIRYGTAFETHIDFLDQYITSAEMLVKIVTTYQGSHMLPVLVDCVDNNKTRVFIHEAFHLLQRRFQGVFSLSSGNEFLNGQVVCGYSSTGLEENEEFPTFGIFTTPTVTDVFPEIMKGGDKLPTELSCDEAAVSHPQNIMVNITAANHLFNFANILMTAKESNEQLPGLKHFAVTYDTQMGTTRTFLNKPSIMSYYVVYGTE